MPAHKRGSVPRINAAVVHTHGADFTRLSSRPMLVMCVADSGLCCLRNWYRRAVSANVHHSLCSAYPSFSAAASYNVGPDPYQPIEDIASLMDSRLGRAPREPSQLSQGRPVVQLRISRTTPVPEKLTGSSSENPRKQFISWAHTASCSLAWF